MLFVSWGNYECPELSGDTRLVLFGYGFHTKNINSFDDPNVRWNFVLWPLWLILCLACTLALTIILALTGPDAAQDVSDSRSPSTMPSESANTPVLQVLARAARNGIVTWATKGHQRALFVDSLSFIMWVGLIVCKCGRSLYIPFIHTVSRSIRGPAVYQSCGQLGKQPERVRTDHGSSPRHGPGVESLDLVHQLCRAPAQGAEQGAARGPSPAPRPRGVGGPWPGNRTTHRALGLESRKRIV